MNEKEAYHLEESAACGTRILENLAAILGAYHSTTVHELYRTVYATTACGPWLSVLTHDGIWRPCNQLGDIVAGNVRGLRLGSIVEGCEATVTGHMLDLLQFETPVQALAAFEAELATINEVATTIHEDNDGE